jgi:hypothetical protein
VCFCSGEDLLKIFQSVSKSIKDIVLHDSCLYLFVVVCLHAWHVSSVWKFWNEFVLKYRT